MIEILVLSSPVTIPALIVITMGLVSVWRRRHGEWVTHLPDHKKDGQAHVVARAKEIYAGN